MDGSMLCCRSGPVKFLQTLFLISMALCPLPAALVASANDPGLKVKSDGTSKEDISPSSSLALLSINEQTGRAEVRDAQGLLVAEIEAGTAGRAVDVSGQEYKISYGKDDLGRKSLLVKAGPAMRKPITVDIFGRKAVLSPEASLLATVISARQVLYEPSLCGQVYYIEKLGAEATPLTRPTTAGREVAVLAKPANPNEPSPRVVVDEQQDAQNIKRAGDAIKSAFCAVLGLPDKESTGKAKVYRLRKNRDRPELPDSGESATP